MAEVLKITDDIKRQHKERIDKLVERQNDRIKSAMERGAHSTVFGPDTTDPDYKELRLMYEKEGYHIKPTGYIGGVWQLSEDICW